MRLVGRFEEEHAVIVVHVYTYVWRKGPTGRCSAPSPVPFSLPDRALMWSLALLASPGAGGPSQSFVKGGDVDGVWTERMFPKVPGWNVHRGTDNVHAWT